MNPGLRQGFRGTLVIRRAEDSLVQVLVITGFQRFARYPFEASRSVFARFGEQEERVVSAAAIVRRLSRSPRYHFACAAGVIRVPVYAQQ
jgi:hypothetical protein